ncbi:MAG: WD40/YVTN/BNR-like repeat-containing protein [Bacteroidota bacterium]
MKTLMILAVISFTILRAQHIPLSRLDSYSLTGSADARSPLSNSIVDIVISNDTIWLGTGKGLSRSVDGGFSWRNYYGTPAFGTENISAIAVRGSDIWIATAHSVERDGTFLPEGSGFRHSTDGGETWTAIAQPLDSKNVDTLYYNDKSLIRALGITTAINNITYDIALTKDAVWIASFAGMVRKSTDNGTTWDRVIIPPDNLDSISPDDSLVFDLSPSGGALGLQNNLNHRAFSVLAENDSTIWIGTAGGINKTTDNGTSWNRFTKQNQNQSISGNFVVALAMQNSSSGKILWAATVNASDNTEVRGVSYTLDNGATWKRVLLREFAHNFGFNGDNVYVPTDNGIFRSADLGNTWIKNGLIYDKSNRQQYTQSTFYAAASSGDTIWFGGADGVVRTIDNAAHPFGSNWSILHASQPLKTVTDTYAFPNPFAPDDEPVRIHYSTGKSGAALVTIRIFDFGMNLVKTVVQNGIRGSANSFDELWDGKSEHGQIVSNGVYFYQIIVDSDEPRWGKILVIK